jgi:hypothetical protein
VGALHVRGQAAFCLGHETPATAYLPALRGALQRERKVKHFSCLDPYLSTAFAQLIFRESLRDIKA